jgi:two-component system, cell cycle sensor histidine kinase and response regulator CckA
VTTAARAWAVLAVGLVASVVCIVIPTSSAANWAYYGAGLFAFLAGWIAVGSRRLAGRYLGLMLLGASVWFLGDMVWFILTLVGHPAGFPSAVDAVYFLGYPLVVAGLVAVWRRQLASALGGLLDGAALAAAGGLLLWATVVDPTGGPHQPLLTTVTAVGYPILDLFVLFGLAQLMLTPALRRTRALQALMAGSLLYVMSDVFYAYTSVRGTYVASWRDFGWLMLYALWAFAVIHPSAREFERARDYRLPSSNARIVLLALGCLAAPLAMYIAIRRGTLEPELYAVSIAAIFLLVFWRMWVIFSEYRHAEAAAHEGREFYRALVENGSDLVMLMDMDGDILFASPSFKRILGYPPAVIVGKSMLAITEPDDLPIAAVALAAAAAGHPIAPFTIRARDAQGAIVWLEVTATAIEARGGKAILSQARDITQRRLTESALAETSRTLETLVAASPTAVVGLDIEARVTLWSPGAAQLFGWTSEEVIGRTTPLRSADELCSDFFEHYFQSGPVVEEGTRLRKDGTRVDIALSAIPMHDKDGAVIGTIGVFLDISERKQLEESLRQAQRLESIGLLAGGVAHDFNNLLTAIGGYAYLALERAGDDDDLRTSLDEIVRAGDRATDLTRQLLAFSRRQTLQPTTFDLNRAIAESTSLLSRLLGDHVRIDTSFHPGKCGVRADPGQIEQVLTNLAVNSRDAMVSGGTLTIETDRTVLAAADAETLELEGGPHVVLRVADTGVGMDADTAVHAFDPFFTTKPVGKGTGLGLATVYGIVHQSGGAVTIDSTPGAGTSVSVFLPEYPIDADAGDAVARPRVTRGRERILLVEDEEAVRRLTARLLERSGYQVIGASGPLQALEIAGDAAIDLLATDVVMPDMDGTQLAKRLREHDPDLPVLFLSGHPRGAALDDTLTQARTGFLQKPYDLPELAYAVRSALDD